MNTPTNISKDALSQIEGAFHREIRGALSKQKQAVIMGKFRQVIAAYLPMQQLPDVDTLAQELRRVDGKHDLGAGALAEALLPFLQAQGYAAVTAEMVRRADHYCPTDMPSFGKWEWKAAHIRQAMLATQQVFDIPAFLRRGDDQVVPAGESGLEAQADTSAKPQPYTASGAAAWVRAGGTALGYAAHQADAKAASEASSSGASQQ